MKGWTEKTIKQIAEFKYGKSLPSRDRKEGDIPVYGSGGVGGYHNEALINSGIIIGRKGTVGSVRYSKTPFYPIDTVFYVDNVNKGNDIKFLYYYLQTIGLEQFDSDAAVPGLNRNLVHRLKGYVPEDINVQKKIASILSAYDDLIEVNNERIKILEETVGELYKEWFVRMRFPGYKKAKFNKGIPEGWSIQSLYDIADITYGYPFKSELFNESGEGTPLIRIRDLVDGVTHTYTPEVTDEKYFALDGDILVGMDGDFHFCKWAGVKAWINQRNVRLRPKDSKGISKYFLYHVAKPQIEFLNEIIVGTTVAHLSATDLRKMKLLIPDKTLLKKFKEYSDPIFEQEILLKKQNTELAAIRDRLLPRLISGRLQVKAS